MRRTAILGGLSMSLVAVSAKANVQPYYVNVPIDQAAIDADPSLANFRAWDLHVVVTGNGGGASGQDRFTLASLYSPLAPGAFYSPVDGGDKPLASGAANLAFDTYINIPLYVPGTTDPLFAIPGKADGHGTGPAIFPRAGEQQSLISVTWGSFHVESGNGDYTIARLTVSNDATGPVEGFAMSTSDLNVQTSFGVALAFNNGVLSAGGSSAFNLLADANKDNQVNSMDFNAVAQGFNKSGSSWISGDFNGDGITNALDFNALASNYGGHPSVALGSVIPEPATFALLMTSFAMMRCRRGTMNVPRKRGG